MTKTIRKIARRLSRRRSLWHDEGEALKRRVAKSRAAYTPNRKPRWYTKDLGF